MGPDAVQPFYFLFPSPTRCLIRFGSKLVPGGCAEGRAGVALTLPPLGGQEEHARFILHAELVLSPFPEDAPRPAAGQVDSDFGRSMDGAPFPSVALLGQGISDEHLDDSLSAISTRASSRVFCKHETRAPAFGLRLTDFALKKGGLGGRNGAHEACVCPHAGGRVLFDAVVCRASGGIFISSSQKATFKFESRRRPRVQSFITNGRRIWSFVKALRETVLAADRPLARSGSNYGSSAAFFLL